MPVVVYLPRLSHGDDPLHAGGTHALPAGERQPATGAHPAGHGDHQHEGMGERSRGTGEESRKRDAQHGERGLEVQGRHARQEQDEHDEDGDEREPLEAPLATELFAKAVRKAAGIGADAAIRVTEMFPQYDRLWLPDSQGNLYTCELRTVALDLQ